MMKEEKIARIEELTREIMYVLDIEANDSNRDTPRRVAKMYVNELFKNVNDENISELHRQMTLFKNEGVTTPIIVKDIPFSSTCEHHWLPFSGKVTVAYVPDKVVIGLSKIPRVVKYFSKQPTLQEKLGKDIGEYLFKKLQPLCIMVFITSTHSCVKCRGAESDCSTITRYSKWDGQLDGKEDLIYTITDLIEKRVGVL